jgi:hypothetical protein
MSRISVQQRKPRFSRCVAKLKNAASALIEESDLIAPKVPAWFRFAGEEFEILACQ